MEIERDGDENGWVINYSVIQAVQDMANQIEYVSMEQVEAVILAMIDLGYVMSKGKG
jgi:hypothetical protein